MLFVYSICLSNNDLRAAASSFAAMSPERLMRCQGDAGDVLFECSLRGFHRDAGEIIRAHEDKFVSLFFDRSLFPSGALALLHSGQGATKYIYMVHVLAATAAIDETTSYQRNIRYALQDMPIDFEGWRGQALQQSIAIAKRLGNRAFLWEAQKHQSARKFRRSFAQPDDPSPVAPLASRRGPQP